MFTVLYSPLKTFEELVQKPDVKGPILIMILTLPLVFGIQLLSGTKFFIEDVTPQDDSWTESILDWSSNGNVTLDESDHVEGNYSISTSTNNTLQVWIRLVNLEGFNRSQEYENLSFRLKWVNEANVVPTSTVQLFSHNNQSSRFEQNITLLTANETGVWSNVTVDLSSDNWTVPEHQPSWENITGLGFQLVWSSHNNYTLKCDGLYFGKYVAFNTLSTYEILLASSLTSGIVDFMLKWLLLAGFIILALKGFSSWKGSKANVLSTIGYVYSASFVYFPIYLLLLSMLPPLLIPHRVWQPALGEEELAREILLEIYDNNWGNQLPYNLMLPSTLALHVWIALLCTVAVKKIHEFTWGKALLIAVTALTLSLLFRAFIPL